MSFLKKSFDRDIRNLESSKVMDGRGTMVVVCGLADEHIVNLMACWQGRITNLKDMTIGLGPRCSSQTMQMIAELEEAILLCNDVLLKREGRKIWKGDPGYIEDLDEC
jgi:hypothetical protein